VLPAGAAASWLASQTGGYLVAVRLASGFANAYSGYAAPASVAAISIADRDNGRPTDDEKPVRALGWPGGRHLADAGRPALSLPCPTSATP
jgi:hypothetical protein